MISHIVIPVNLSFCPFDRQIIPTLTYFLTLLSLAAHLLMMILLMTVEETLNSFDFVLVWSSLFNVSLQKIFIPPPGNGFFFLRAPLPALWKFQDLVSFIHFFKLFGPTDFPPPLPLPLPTNPSKFQSLLWGKYQHTMCSPPIFFFSADNTELIVSFCSKDN